MDVMKTLFLNPPSYEDFDGGAEDLGGLLDFFFAAEGEGAAGFAPVADVAVGDGDEFDVMALGGPESADAAGLELAIVGVGAEADDAEFAVVGGSGESGEGEKKNSDAGEK